MNAGAEHAGGSYVRPRTLRLPARPPKLVYLDLNQWIALSKAMAGHKDGKNHVNPLTTCLRAMEDGRAIFPLSDSIYSEVSKIGPHRQRRDLREVMEHLSRFMVVMSRSDISAHEIEAVLDQAIGPSPHPINTMDYLDVGVARAFGKVGGFRIRRKDGEDVTATVRATHPGSPAAFDQILANAELALNRKVIEGPSPDEEPELRGLGWNPTAAFEVAKRRARQEAEQVARFNQEPRWRRGRIRDVVAARETYIEINEALYKGLAERGAKLEDISRRVEDIRRFFDAMPSFDVAVSLKAALHRDPGHRWTPNDIHDIDALGSTLPYCDVVVTDKAMADRVRRAKLDKRLGTVVLSTLQAVAEQV